MDINSTKGDEVLASLSYDELRFIRQALNEVLNGLDDPELPTRMGAEQEELEILLAELGEAIEKAKIAQ
jgi:hypothetical protein